MQARTFTAPFFIRNSKRGNSGARLPTHGLSVLCRLWFIMAQGSITEDLEFKVRIIALVNYNYRPELLLSHSLHM